MDNLTNTDDMNGDSAPTGQLLSHQDSAMSTDSPNGSSYTRQGSSSSSSKGNRRRSSIGSSQKSSRRGSQRLVGSAASAPPPPRYYDGDKPPGPAKYRWPTEEPQLAEARLRDGVCRVADTCGNPDTGASGCYFIFRGYPCIVTSLLQVAKPFFLSLLVQHCASLSRVYLRNALLPLLVLCSIVMLLLKMYGYLSCKDTCNILILRSFTCFSDKSHSYAFYSRLPGAYSRECTAVGSFFLSR